MVSYFREFELCLNYLEATLWPPLIKCVQPLMLQNTLQHGIDKRIWKRSERLCVGGDLR